MTSPRSSRLVTALVLVALVARPAVAHAQAEVLDFSPFLGFGSTLVPQSYGDLPGALDVAYQQRGGGFGNTYVHSSLIGYWGSGYSKLVGVGAAWVLNVVPEISLTPLNGGTVALHSLKFGSWLADANGVGPDRPFNFYVWDGNWNFLYGGAFVANSALTLSPNVSSAAGLILQWGFDANVGIDDISITVRPAAVTAAPEPATLALVATGLAALGAVARRGPPRSPRARTRR
jgi:hypothetical protein